MLSPKFVSFLMCLFLRAMAQATEVTSSSSAHPEGVFLSVQTGENLTLKCFYKVGDYARLYWYKHLLGRKPTLVSTINTHVPSDTQQFFNEFEKEGRFTLDTGSGNYHLKISSLQIADSASYYCICNDLHKVEFVTVISVIVTASDVTVPALVHQSTSGSIQSEDSVTLSCTVHTGTCDGEHSVYWFKHSEESHPGLIYTHGGRNDQCDRKDNTQTHTCVYNLPLKELNVSHAWTYYCAVASCGHILFGNGIKLDFKDDRVLVYFLSSALAFTTILVITLGFSVYKINKRSSSQSSEPQSRFSAASTENTEGNADNLHYAAVNIKKPNRSRRQNNSTNDECVYSRVRL